jgi:hypothetical protein
MPYDPIPFLGPLLSGCSGGATETETGTAMTAGNANRRDGCASLGNL